MKLRRKQKNTVSTTDLEKELLPYFKVYKKMYHKIEVPKEGLQDILLELQIGEKPTLSILNFREKTSWWRIGAVLIPSALLVTLMLGTPASEKIVENLGSSTTTNNVEIKEALVDIEKLVYNIEASDPVTDEEDRFIIALAEEDPALTFNVNYYEDF